MFWGVKSHWTDFRWSGDIAYGLELHENEEDMHSSLSEQKAEVSSLGRPTAVHVPIRTNGKLFGLSDERELEFAVKCAEIGKLVVVHGDFRVSGFLDRLRTLLETTDSVICLENRPGIFHKRHKLSYPEDFKKVFDKVDHKRLGMTLDIAHLWMGRDPKTTFDRFIDDFSNKIRHIHIVDSDGKEERQIGYGTVDFDHVFERLSELKRDVMVIPEVPGGQIACGAGFRYAINKLRNYPINQRPASPSSWP